MEAEGRANGVSDLAGPAVAFAGAALAVVDAGGWENNDGPDEAEDVAGGAPNGDLGASEVVAADAVG